MPFFVAASLLTAVLASVPIPVAPRSAERLDVERESIVAVPLTRGARPAVRYLPSHVGIELDVPLSVDDATRATDGLESGLRATVEAALGGSRIQIVHPRRAVRATIRTSKGASSKGASSKGAARGVSNVVVGAVSEDRRLRDLTRIIARPLPLPNRLGAYLELWQEAEAALGRGELRRALELWKKLGRTASVRDLAAVRTAELFVLSGHISEAVARLSSVSRRHPRSTGATLARLDLLHLDAITADKPPTEAQVLLTGQAVDRRRFEAYTWFRASMVLAELGHSNSALKYLPRADAMPESWRDAATDVRLQLLEDAICRPTLVGNPAATVDAHARWRSELAHHPRRSGIMRHVVDAFAALGLHDASVDPLRALLRELPPPAEEARLVLALADAYVAQADLPRGLEVLTFAAKNHPKMPGLETRIRALGVQTYKAKGLDAARTMLRSMREHQPALKASVLALEADLAVAYGTPLVQVQALSLLRKRGFDAPQRRGPQLGLALARAGRAKEAAPLLRTWIGKTTDAELRDHMAYRLAGAEQALGRDADAAKILKLIATHGTTYGQIARVRLQERVFEGVLRRLPKTPPESSQP